MMGYISIFFNQNLDRAEAKIQQLQAQIDTQDSTQN